MKRFFLLVVRWSALLLACAALGTGAFLLFSHHTDVPPLTFHPDEPSKVGQILDQDRNFRHPILMLDTTQFFYEVLQLEEDPQVVVQVGRRVVAGFAAGAVVLLALTALLLRGWPAFLGVGGAVLLSHNLVLFAHNFKEDPMLVFGLSAFAFTVAAHWKYRSWYTALLLGAGSVMPFTGKYMGLVMLPVGFFLLFAWPRKPVSPWIALRIPLWFLGAGVTLVLLYFRAFMDLERFLDGFANEANHGLSGHTGLTSSFPNLYWVHALGVHLTWPVLTLAGIYLVGLGASFWKNRWGEVAQVGIIAFFFLALLTCPIPFDRYALPMLVYMHFLAGLGSAEIPRWILSLIRPPAAAATPGPAPVPAPTPDAPDAPQAPEPAPAPATSTDAGTAPLTAMLWRSLAVTAYLVALGLLLWIQIPRCRNFLDQIKNDSRFACAAYVKKNLPQDAVILEDLYAGLRGQLGGQRRRSTWGWGPQASLRIYSGGGVLASGFGSFESLRANGVTHVAVSSIAYDRYFNPYLYPIPGYEEGVAENRQFYEKVFTQCELIWEYTPAIVTGSCNNPPIKLYRLPPEEPKPRKRRRIAF